MKKLMKLISIFVAMSAMGVMLAGCPADDTEGTNGATDTAAPAGGDDDMGGDDNPCGDDEDAGDDAEDADGDDGENPCGGGEEGD